jgi:hypothetical protein
MLNTYMAVTTVLYLQYHSKVWNNISEQRRDLWPPQSAGHLSQQDPPGRAFSISSDRIKRWRSGRIRSNPIFYMCLIPGNFGVQL